MSKDVELLRRFLDATVEPHPDLGGVRDRLSREIVGAPAVPARRRDAGTPRKRLRGVLAGVAATGAAAVLLAILLPSGPSVPPSHGAPPRPHPPMAVGLRAQLRLIADHVMDSSSPRLAQDQLLLTQADLSVDATVNDGAAEATIDLSVQKWSTATGETCTALTADPAQFATPAQQAAWTGLGLLTLPQPSTADQCLEGTDGAPPDAITGAGQLIDVSALPTDPQTLDQELESHTTGISVLDQMSPDLAAPNLAFQRAAMLLIGPTVGASAQFSASLFQAIALIPGVVAIGPTTTHDGQTGQGFASGPGSGQTTIVVDPTTGRLLEVRGLDDSTALGSIATNYLAGGPLHVGQYSTGLQWIDPVGSPTVVSLADLPAGVPTYVFATTIPSVTLAQLQPLIEEVQTVFARSVVAYGEHPATLANTSATVFWKFAPDPAPSQVAGLVQTLRSSGLFTAVTEI